MTSIFSRINNVILCNYIHKSEINEYRSDLSSENEILQGCARKLAGDIIVAPHKHLPIERVTLGTQEAWVILEGKILAKIYDIDDTFLTEVELISGSCMIFFNGGHSLKVLEHNTFFYEFKNGPYYGFDKDKHNI
jgi:hypothetical protein